MSDFYAQLRVDLLVNALFLSAQFRSEVFAEVFGLEDLANLDFTVFEWRAFEPFDRFVERFAFSIARSRRPIVSFRAFLSFLSVLNFLPFIG